MFGGFGRLQRSLVAMLVAIALVLSAFTASVARFAMANGPANCSAGVNYSAGFNSPMHKHSLNSKAKAASVEAAGPDERPASPNQLPANCCDSLCTPAFVLSASGRSSTADIDGAIPAMKFDSLRSTAKDSPRRPPREAFSPLARA